MRARITNFLQQIYPLATLLVLVLLFFLTNFQPGTLLSGWDNLHPEFNFILNIKRSFFAVWQEYQGLGLLGGMGHASDLIRQIILWLFSVVIPNQYLRYFYHFSMLLAGPIGCYFLLKDIVFENSKNSTGKIASLIGAIFYLFNLATLQVFFFPFEAYSAHFAALPWLLWASLRFLKEGGRKNLLILTLINLFSLTQAYVPTFFIVYLISLGLIFLFYLNKFIQMKRILLVLSVTLMINTFWLLPNLYFVATSTKINLNAKINQMATEDNLLKNKKFGNLGNTTLLKGFWFDSVEINKDGVSEYQFKDWIDYTNKPPVKAVGYLLFLTSIAGIVLAFIQKKLRPLIFLPPLLLSFIVISSNTPVLSSLADLFFKIPLFSQVFRFPFMKFSILLALCLSIFYAFSYFSLARFLKKRFFQLFFGLIFIILPIVFLFPTFQGKLFYNKEKAQIPNEYFQLFDFFKKQNPNTRIANFPQSTFWGWNFYHWNYSGSGFIWYGITQPILDRAFDPWSNKNENYYWEISYALYSKNLELFEKVLEKYQVNWLLVDENIITAGSAKSLYFDELEKMISFSNKVSLVQTFGKIQIYQVNLETPANNFVFSAENLPAVNPIYKWNNFDQSYLENGNYISDTQHVTRDTNLTSVYYPFRSLFSGRSQNDLEFEVEDRGDFFVFKKTLPPEFKDYILAVPQADDRELPNVDPQNLGKIEYLQPDIFLDGLNLEVKVPKVGGYLSAQIEPASDPQVQEAKNCNQFSLGEVKNEITSDGFLRLTSVNALNCSASFWLPNLPHNLAYLITVQSQHQTGKSLLFWLENLNLRKADIETYLPKWKISYFIQPPMEKDGLGYSLHFDNNSIGQEKSVNDLGKITVNPIPYKFLTELKFINPATQPTETKLLPIGNVNHPNPSFYEINIQHTTYNTQQSPTLVLSQSYNHDWQAYIINDKWSMINGKLGGLLTPILGKRIEEHVSVNSWENGWALKENLGPDETLVVLFLPQLLEYLGFALFILTVGMLLFAAFRHPTHPPG